MANKCEDSIQKRLTDYAYAFNFEALSAKAIHAAKVRVIDTLGALVAGFFAAPCRIARDIAALSYNNQGATIIGTRMKTTPDMAAFVNGTTQRYMELTDSYHWPGSYGGHPSDVVTPVLAAAEYARSSGRDLITGIILAYEIYLRLNDVFRNRGFDHTIFCSLATASAAGKLLGLSATQLAHSISMAAVSNNALRVARIGHLSMWSKAATGQAGRAGVFSALLARAGMEGPHLPFEGKSGWCDHVALERITLGPMGGDGTAFKIVDPSIKLRPAGGMLIPAILAAEEIGQVDLNEVKKVLVEVHGRVALDKDWAPPESAESAFGNVPYVVATVLMDGTVTLRSYRTDRLYDPQLLALMQKTQVIENEDYTEAYNRLPVEHHARVTVVMNSGERLAGEARDTDNLTGTKSDIQIARKFRSLTEDILGTNRVEKILDCLWNLEDLKDVSSIPEQFAFV